MHEILFRGKRTDNGEWVEGSLHIDPDLKTASIWWFGYSPDEMERWEEAESVDSETVGQFTGLTDKNGRKIFEGDIVEYDEELCPVVYEPDAGMFELCGFGFVADFSYIDSSIFCEIVGNIYDNPEMLEMSKND